MGEHYLNATLEELLTGKVGHLHGDRANSVLMTGKSRGCP